MSWHLATHTSKWHRTTKTASSWDHVLLETLPRSAPDVSARCYCTHWLCTTIQQVWRLHQIHALATGTLAPNLFYHWLLLLASVMIAPELKCKHLMYIQVHIHVAAVPYVAVLHPRHIQPESRVLPSPACRYDCHVRIFTGSSVL